jgi:uncharacterized protein
MTDATLIDPAVDLERDGRHHGYLRLPHSVTRSAYGWIPIPITSLRNGKGPRIILMAGTHGDEYEGQIVLSRLANELDCARLTGQLILLPMANFPAARAGARISPIDAGNLNRSYPGDPLGGPTKAIAHFIETVLMPGAHLVIDLHSGGSSLVYLPTVMASWPKAEAKRRNLRGLLGALGLPHILVFPPDLGGHFSTSAAARNSITGLTIEIGGGGTVEARLVAQLEAALYRALAQQGLLAEAPADDRNAPPRYMSVGRDDYVYAMDEGIFEPVAALGETVAAGALAARIHRPETPGAAPIEVRFETAGLVICARVPARVERGDCLYHLAREDAAPT